MTGYLLDTNAVAEMRRPRPNEGFCDFVERLPAERLFTSDITLAEIRFGIERASAADLRLRLTQWLDGVVRPLFKGRVLSVTEDVWLRWRLMLEEGRRTGYTFPQPDLMLAALAAHYGLEVISRDTEPFRRAGVTVVDPWTG